MNSVGVMMTNTRIPVSHIDNAITHTLKLLIIII